MSTTGVMTSTGATLEVPGARLHYELRGAGSLAVLVGAPMDAAAFAPLAESLATDHTVLTTDPRGIHRSQVDNPEADSTPELRADDLSALIAHVGAGPAVVFGSSGGAVTALALVQAHPEQVHTVIAHEPPLDELLEDREQQRARTEDCCETYLAGDVVGAWTKFLDQANIAIPAEVVEQMFGGERVAQVVTDERFWFAHELRPSTWWRPDLAALRSVPSRIVVGLGADSTGQACDHTSRALASALDTEPTMFPGGHTGFVDAPDVFAHRLRSVLNGS
ncbi:MAG: alpha/beta hydrolase [Pseudonocardia sp.]|nr:alpha/beta hydrolase [Pseudonocardia sp.]